MESKSQNSEEEEKKEKIYSQIIDNISKHQKI